MRPIGASVQVAYPHDGTQRDKGSGITLARQYKAEGLLMLPEHATHADGGYQTEPGILEMLQRMRTGRLKVAAHLTDWWQEFRNYHRKDGLIVKMNDDIMSASRVAIMARRHARPGPLGGGKPKRRGPEIAEGIDFDVFDC